MRFSALSKPLWFYTACLAVIACFFLLLPQRAHAIAPSPSPAPVNYNTPDFNSDVPRNQHTYVQSTMIEVLAAFNCIVIGVDPINPGQGCLTIDGQTHKLGLAPVSENQPLANGLLGIIPGMYKMVYAPPASSMDYMRDLADNFGIVEPAHAQGTGFQALTTLQTIWVSVRNVTYILFVLIFIIIGLAIMLRVRIDPRTVMTLQNQIPRIIIGILLITFSYAIVGFMIDMMWLATYTGINIITQSGGANTNPKVEPSDPAWYEWYDTLVNPTGVCDSVGQTLQQRASQGLQTVPLWYAGYGDKGILKQNCDDSGVWSVAKGASDAISYVISGLIRGIFNDAGASCGFLTPGACFASALGSVAGFLTMLIMACIVVWTLLRIWFELLKAYIMIILYTITGPFWILLGLLPGKPLGFEKWFRRLFVNLAVFPATALLLVTAAILINLFKNPSPTTFVPPLLGNPDQQGFGYLLAFGVLLVTPGLLNILKSALHAVGKQGALASAAIANQVAGGAAPAKGLGKGTWNRAFYHNPYTGQVGAGFRLLRGATPTVNKDGTENFRSSIHRWRYHATNRLFHLRNPNATAGVPGGGGGGGGGQA